MGAVFGLGMLGAEMAGRQKRNGIFSFRMKMPSYVMAEGVIFKTIFQQNDIRLCLKTRPGHDLKGMYLQDVEQKQAICGVLGPRNI